jgi:hypothetical protein
MAIKTGIGIGEAQVYDTSGLVGNFAKLLQKQQQDEIKFQTEIADLISRVDTKGVRDADKLEIANMYQATKDLYRQAAQAKTFQEKALLRSKISKAVSDINEYAQNSAGWVKKYDSLARDVASNPWAYEPTVVERLRGLKDKPLSKMGADIALDPFEYQKVPSIKSRDNVFDDIRKRGEQFATFTTKNIGGGQKQYIGKLGDDKIKEIITVNLATNPEYKATVLSQWSKMNPGKPLDPNEIINSEVSLYKSQYGTEYKRDPRDIAKEKSGDTIIIGGGSIQPKSFVTDDVVKKDKNNKPVVDKNGRPVMQPGKVVLDFSQWLNINPKPFTMPQLGKRLNVSTGNWEPYRSSGNVEMVGVGIRSGSGAYNAIIKDKDGVEYMVTEQDLPLEIRGNNIYEAAKAAVYSGRSAQPRTQPGRTKVNY